MDLSSLDLWKEELKSIPDDFIESIEQFIALHWFDHNYQECINGFVMTTNDCKTYVYGNKVCKWISLEHHPNQPQLMPILNGKNISQVGYGCIYFVILTDDGLVYLGGGSSWNTNKQLKLISTNNQRFKQIACGYAHFFLLTTDNKLMAMGMNVYGQIAGTVGVDSYQTMVDTGLNNVMKMVCGAEHSLAITTDHKIYAWGSNFHSQLGVNGTNERNPITLIEYFNSNQIIIKDIAAGWRHSLFLSENGELYGCGLNSHGELGLKGFQSYTLMLTKLPIKNLSVIESGWSYRFSMASTNDHSSYVWGKFNDNVIWLPIKFNQSFIDVASFFLVKSTTFGWRRISKPIFYQKKLIKSIQKWFNDPSNHDFTFCFANGKKIYAKRQYLSDLSEYFGKQLSSDWSDQKSIEIQYYSYEIFYSYIRLLHFHSIEINENNLTELLDLGECYLDKELVDLCQQFMIDNLNLMNCDKFSQLALKYRLKKINPKFKELILNELSSNLDEQCNFIGDFYKNYLEGCFDS